MLSFTLLGPVILSKDGVLLEQFRSQKEAALLIYLAHTGETHRRDFLADLLWESSSTSQSLSNLRTVLTRLRKKVGDDLCITRKTLALTPESLQQVDSVNLLRSIAEHSRIETAAQADALLQTLDAYRGDFLDGFDLSDTTNLHDWMLSTREHIRRRVLAAYDKLGRYAQTADDPAFGRTVARRRLQVDQLDEAAHTLLIQMELAAGNTRAAVAHYEHCVALLQSELGVEPPAEMTALIMPAQTPRPAVTVSAPPTGPRHNLPAEHDQFFGRHAAQQEIHVRLDQPWCRVVTVVGQGGVGKTRLALTIARSRLRQYPDGVWLVELADLDPDDDDLSEAIAVEIATVVGLRLTGSGTPLDQLRNHLQHKQMMLVLDNFEHVLDGGVPVVLDLAQQCEQVQILITSREALQIRAEWMIKLGGLSFPHSDIDQMPSEAVALFVARRAQQRHEPPTADDLAAIRAICRLVEGLPLAVELAAALTRHAAVRTVAGQLRDGFDALTTSLRDVPDRHRGFHLVFDVSWRTLSPALQQRLARLAVFRGGFTAAAAQQIAAATAEQITTLTDKSLVAHDDDADRYTLHPIIRAYAGRRLDPADGVVEKYGRYYLTLLAEQADTLQKDTPQDAMRILRPEIENVRRAWQTGLTARWADLLTAALPALSIYYQLRSTAHEAEAMMQTTITAVEQWPHPHPPLRIQAGLERARFQNRLARHRPAIKTLQKALAGAKQNGDRWAEGMGLIWWGEALWRLGEYDAARRKLDTARTMAQEIEDPAVMGWYHHQAGIIDDIQGRYETAQHHLEQACDHWRTLENTQCLSNSLNSLGAIRHHRGDLPGAQEALAHALTLCDALGNRHVQTTLLNNLSILSTEQQDYAGAQYYLQLSLRLAEATGNRLQQTQALINLGHNYYWLGEIEAAVEYLTRGLQLARATNNLPDVAVALINLGTVQRKQGKVEQAESSYQRALDIARQHNLQRLECSILLDLAELKPQADAQRARESGRRALKLAEEMKNAPLVERATSVVRNLETSSTS